MKKGELTRQQIIVKAAPIFNQRGFAGCSMQNLMEATGLKKGGLYRHFTSKEQLALESFQYSVQQAVTARIADLEELSGAIPRLRHVVQAFVKVSSPIPGGCPLMNAAADVDAGSEMISAHARKAVGVWKSKLCRVLKEGMDSGELRMDIDPRKTANLLLSTLEGALMVSRLEGTKQAMHDAQSSLEALLKTLAVSKPKVKSPTRLHI
jgi:TetR/AcrR family transcriptional regulator, transcriptional repressor for nem operon